MIELRKSKGYQARFHGSIVKAKTIQMTYYAFLPESIERNELR